MLRGTCTKSTRLHNASPRCTTAPGNMRSEGRRHCSGPQREKHDSHVQISCDIIPPVPKWRANDMNAMGSTKTKAGKQHRACARAVHHVTATNRVNVHGPLSLTPAVSGHPTRQISGWTVHPPNSPFRACCDADNLRLLAP